MFCLNQTCKVSQLENAFPLIEHKVHFWDSVVLDYLQFSFILCTLGYSANFYRKRYTPAYTLALLAPEKEDKQPTRGGGGGELPYQKDGENV